MKLICAMLMISQTLLISTVFAKEASGIERILSSFSFSSFFGSNKSKKNVDPNVQLDSSYSKIEEDLNIIQLTFDKEDRLFQGVNVKFEEEDSLFGKNRYFLKLADVALTPTTAPTTPTTSPTAPPTAVPSPVPSTMPTPYPVAAGAVPVSFVASQAFTGISVQQYNQQAGSNLTIQQTVAASITAASPSTPVVSSQVAVTGLSSVTPAVVSASFRSHRNLQSTSTTVNYKVSVVSTQPVSVYTAALTTSFYNGTFQQLLETYGNKNGATNLASSTALAPVIPTPASSPTSSPSGLSAGGAFGIACGVILFVLIGATVAYNWTSISLLMQGKTAATAVTQEGSVNALHMSNM